MNGGSIVWVVPVGTIGTVWLIGADRHLIFPFPVILQKFWDLKESVLLLIMAYHAVLKGDYQVYDAVTNDCSTEVWTQGSSIYWNAIT